MSLYGLDSYKSPYDTGTDTDTDSDMEAFTGRTLPTYYRFVLLNLEKTRKITLTETYTTPRIWKTTQNHTQNHIQNKTQHHMSNDNFKIIHARRLQNRQRKDSEAIAVTLGNLHLPKPLQWNTMCTM